jgi:predicted acetyltransferase
MPLLCRQAQAEDFLALAQLLELYQYELSDIWHQDLDAQARYGYDLSRHKHAERFFAHVALDGTQYLGFALVAPAAVTRTEGCWMEQFFVLKRHRRSGVGLQLARHVFVSHPGLWEVGQMPASAAARVFWRSVIGTATGGQFTEVEVTEGWWQGFVQQFCIGREVLHGDIQPPRRDA